MYKGSPENFTGALLNTALWWCVLQCANRDQFHSEG